METPFVLLPDVLPAGALKSSLESSLDLPLLLKEATMKKSGNFIFTSSSFRRPNGLNLALQIQHVDESEGLKSSRSNLELLLDCCGLVEADV